MVRVFLKAMVGSLGVLFSFALLALLIMLWPWGWSPSWRSFIPWSTSPLRLTTQTGRPDLSAPTEAPVTFDWVDRLAIREPKPWQLLHQIVPPPFGKDPYLRPELGPFATEAACQQALAAKVAIFHDAVARQTPGQITLSRLSNGYRQKLGNKSTQETWTCAMREEPPS